MKTYLVRTARQSDEELVLNILRSLERKGIIVLEEEGSPGSAKNSAPATEEQVQEIIDEAELGAYYSEEEARKILNL